MQMRRLHNWNLSYSEAISLQKRLAGEVQFTPVNKPPKLVAGLDCAISKDGRRIVAAVLVLRAPSAEQSDFEVLETANAVEKTDFPYIPGLLSFREAPACIAAAEKLKSKPDVFLIDGQGIAHPRRLGLAAHLGLFFDSVTIGCAKSRLTGQFEEPLPEKGAYSLLRDKNEVIGAVVRTRTNVKPVFVSVGNKCLLEDAIKIILGCTTKYRIPEPTRLAHQLVSKLKLKT
jgi:deoxyribonuclease V